MFFRQTEMTPKGGLEGDKGGISVDGNGDLGEQ